MTMSDLKQVERKVLRSYHQDGLLDLLVGVIYLLWATGPLLESWHWPRPYIELAILLLLPFLFTTGKRLITVPRLGFVKLDSNRRIHSHHQRITLLYVGMLTALVALLIIIHRFPNLLGEWMHEYQGLFIEAGIYVVLAGLAAYMLGCPRVILYGLIFGGNIPLSHLWFGNVLTVNGCLILWGLPGLVILLIGVVLLLRFLSKYDKSDTEKRLTEVAP